MAEYSSVEKIAKVRLLCHHVLPAVYDESLSYLEQLAKLTFKVNETITATNALNDNVEALNDSVIELNNRVTVVEGEIAGFEQEVERRFTELTEQIYADVNAKLDEVDVKIADVEARVTTLENTVNATLQEFREYMDVEIQHFEEELTNIVNNALAQLDQRFIAFSEEMREYIQNEIEEALKKIPEITSVMVIDPTTGKLTPIQDTLDNMFTYSSYNALTVDEFNNLGLTVDELNHIMYKSIPMGLTCTQWMHDAKPILLKELSEEQIEPFAYPHSLVKDYLDGSLVWHDRNTDINWMMWAVSGTYSCGELGDMEFTYDELTALEMSVEDWNMSGNLLLVKSA